MRPDACWRSRLCRTGIWQFLRQIDFANRCFDTCDHTVQTCCDAWNALKQQPRRIPPDNGPNRSKSGTVGMRGRLVVATVTPSRYAFGEPQFSAFQTISSAAAWSDLPSSLRLAPSWAASARLVT